ncbi:uncharacterized protein LOC123302927 [Chrysoperla carnea]|uniref:uncharacterized protein LOC123302927 n=1 Tax=Chrysoperla carnea TaxID=189513 RepID=UPI001D05D2F0|nr:uncharacterized protein LOC123302927 [Chrysoperla carnea]
MKTGGADLLKVLKSPEIFDDIKRKAFVRIITAELVDYHQTQYIERDFDYLYKDSADNFLTKFTTYYSPRINQYTKVCKPVLFADAADITDEQLRALVMLSALLPVSNSVLTKRGQGKGKSRKRVHEEIDDDLVLPK